MSKAKWRKPDRCKKTGRVVKSGAVVRAKPAKCRGNQWDGVNIRRDRYVTLLKIGVRLPSGKVFHTSDSSPKGVNLLATMAKLSKRNREFVYDYLEGK